MTGGRAGALVGVDWGTSGFRGYLLATDGTVLDWVASEDGILAVENGSFGAALDVNVGHWLAAAPLSPVIMSGMIGSRQGWKEADYLDCPTDIGVLAGRLTEVAGDSGQVAHIVPGIARVDPDDVPDVIRGEETQIAGALVGHGTEIFVLPGTHSKWAIAEDGRIVWFATFMTGELFAILCRHSILGRTMTGDEHDPAAFHRGLNYGLAAGEGRGGLLKRLFSARTLALFGSLPESGTRSYLSGLLIGCEIAEARQAAAGRLTDDASIVVLGGARLSAAYVDALARAGMEASVGPADCAAHGLVRIARAAGLIGG
ncbi:MAG: 2-dehydro-3-deoxygalactonokinase [Rhodospirillaceae bacterium]|nr:2-dehydro-3-deoxygalactonokinase [Rhodospirillaceae bacterium]